MIGTKRREKILGQFVTKILGTNNWIRTIYIYILLIQKIERRK